MQCKPGAPSRRQYLMARTKFNSPHLLLYFHRNYRAPMKLLLCIPSINAVSSFLKAFDVALTETNPLSYQHSVGINGHEVTLIESGHNSVETCYKVTKALSIQKYHLALHISKGFSLKDDLTPGTVLNVVNEKPVDLGIWQNNEWKDAYDLGELDAATHPHVRGGYINMTNAYINVFLPLKKVVGGTVNSIGVQEITDLQKAKYAVSLLTQTGWGFVYPCLFERQTYYHLSVLYPMHTDTTEAEQKLNETLIDLLHKL